MSDKVNDSNEGAQPATPKEDGGHAHKPTKSSQPGNRRRAFKKPPVTRQAKFKGKCEELSGHIYDCSNSTRQADVIMRITKEIA
jgi:hypothetical protein